MADRPLDGRFPAWAAGPDGPWATPPENQPYGRRNRVGAALDLDDDCADRADRLVGCPGEVVPLVAGSSQLRKGRKGPARASGLTMDGKRSPCGRGLPNSGVKPRRLRLGI